MKRMIMVLLAAMCLLLSGCSLFDGSYVHVTPHKEETDNSGTEVVSADNYLQLRTVVEEMVDSGMENGVINLSDYDQDVVKRHMTSVVYHIQNVYPLGAYAVESVEYEVGTSSGRPAIAVTISYRHGRVEIQKIEKVRAMEQVEKVIGDALEDCSSGIVLRVEGYEETDFSQIVEDYAETHPDTVMETPQVAAGIYGIGNVRVVELTFTYQTNRDSLRLMQSQVKTVFESASLYVSGDGSDKQKLSQLHGFLMERFDYTLETSITPAYSLLRHGVGDSRAFAVVYAAMCRQAGLECRIVTGTKMGEPWTWNIVLDDGYYYHVDLLRSSSAGEFREFVDNEMSGYVWDYSAYPQCVAKYTAPPVTEPEETTENLE